MKSAGPIFPLFNRVVVLLNSSGMLVGIVVVLATPKRRNDLALVDGLLLVLFAVVACGGIWLSLFWRNRSKRELEEEEAFPDSQRPEIPDTALACRYSTLTGSATVYLDANTGKIHFRNCHVRRQFLASADPWFSCKIDELKGVHRFRHRGEFLTIVTASGKAAIPAAGQGYDALRERLGQLAPDAQSGFSTEHPLMGMVYLAGALIGLFAGVFLTPRDATDATLGLFVLVGTTLGIAGSILLVSLGDR